MNYPCAVIRDLLPLYTDGICSAESADIIKSHLSECENCRKYYEAMKSENGFAEISNSNPEDLKMADSLKRIKGKINKKFKITVVCAAVACVMIAFLYNLLFNMPLKSIPADEITVDAHTYPLGDIVSEASDDSVVIRADQNDNSFVYSITIPDMPGADAAVTENMINENKYVTSISWSGKYYIKDVKYDSDASEGGKTLYVTGFKTSVLGNGAGSINALKSLEFREIDKIVFIDKNGAETELWAAQNNNG